MTNVEKAREISEIHGRGYTFYHSGEEYYVGDSIEECCESALDMAAWKEQQMIEKAVKYLDDMLILDDGNTDKFIEYFKKYMEEN